MSRKHQYVPRVDGLEGRCLLSTVHAPHAEFSATAVRKPKPPAVPNITVSGNVTVRPSPTGAGYDLFGGGTVNPVAGAAIFVGNNIGISVAPGSLVNGTIYVVYPPGSATASILAFNISGRVPRNATGSVPVTVRLIGASNPAALPYVGETGTGTIRLTSINLDGTGTANFAATLRR